MPHKSFHVPLRISSVNATTSDTHSGSNSRRDQQSRSAHKAQRILGTTDIAIDHDYHNRPEKRTSRRASFLNAPEIFHKHTTADGNIHSSNVRVRASSPLLGHEYRDTANSTSPLLELSRKLHLSGSSSALYSRYTSRVSPAASTTSLPRESDATPDGGLNPAFKQPKGPMKDSKRKTRPPRIDLSLLFPKPQTTAPPLLSPHRMVSSPSAISEVSEITTTKVRKPEPRLAGKKLTKAAPPPRVSSRPEIGHHNVNGLMGSSVTRNSAGPAWVNPSNERTVRTSEMDLALEKDLDGLPTPRSTERARYSPRNFSLRSRDQPQKSDSKSMSSRDSVHSSQRTLREAPSNKSLQNRSTGSAPLRFVTLNKRPTMSKKSSKSTLKNSDLNNSSVLCLSSSEDEADDEEPFRSQLKLGKTKRDSVSTYGDFEAEICTAAAAQATRGTLKSVERPSSSNTQSSRSSSKFLQPQRDSSVSQARQTSTATGNTQPRRSSGIPSIREPDFLHSDPMFDQIKTPSRTPSLSQKEIKRRSRLMAVTRQEERLLEAMRQRQGKITPSIFNESVEPDRRSVVSGSARDSFYCSDTSFLRLSPGIPSPGVARALQSKANTALNPRGGTRSESDETPTNSFPSPRASLISSRSLPSPATSRSSPLTPTLPIHRFSPLPSQKPPPRRPPPPVPNLQRQHSRRRTDSSDAIALDNTADDRKVRESTEYPVWALGWNNESNSLTAVH
ncbi:hypothetical protein BDW59DRAFT_167026 [Aspergillus cavernicola]|uniref:Uncharacterized protein n=1 Tax=Aspergillus cavernicola TaxID=176166 RepID=A0ABR4HH77_9EURO